MDHYSQPDRPRNYCYKSENHSLADKYVLRHWWPIAIKAIPKNCPANAVSIIGNTGVWLSFLLLSGLLAGPFPALARTHPWIFGLIALCLFFYQTLDALDGIQARRLGTAGPLGEFVDHWFDSFNVFLLPFGIALAFPSTPYFFVIILLLLFPLADWILLRSVFDSDTLVFGAVSTEEAQILTQLMLIAMWITGYDFWDRPLWGGMSPVFLLLVFGACGTFFTALGSVKKAKAPAFFAAALVSLLPIALWIAIMFPRLGKPVLLCGGLLLGFSGTRFTGELLRERLVGLEYKPFLIDLLVVDGILLASLCIPPEPRWPPLALGLGCLAWTLFRLGLQFRSVIRRVKEVLGLGLWDAQPRR